MVVDRLPSVYDLVNGCVDECLVYGWSWLCSSLQTSESNVVIDFEHHQLECTLLLQPCQYCHLLACNALWAKTMAVIASVYGTRSNTIKVYTPHQHCIYPALLYPQTCQTITYHLLHTQNGMIIYKMVSYMLVCCSHACGKPIYVQVRSCVCVCVCVCARACVCRIYI